MPELRLSAEVECYPTWLESDKGAENVAPEELPAIPGGRRETRGVASIRAGFGLGGAATDHIAVCETHRMRRGGQARSGSLPTGEELKSETLTACGSALRTLGFIKRKGALVQERGDGVSGWVGLNVATRGLPDSLEVNPVVGVCFADYGAISRALRNDVPPGPAPLISQPLGYLMPERSFRAWRFGHGEDAELQAGSVAEAVEVYGEPFIDAYGDWDRFSGEIESAGLLADHERKKVLPIVFAMNGDTDRALKIVAEEQARVHDLEDMYARSYRDFAGKFFDKFGSASA